MAENDSKSEQTPENPFPISDILLVEYFSLRQLPGFPRCYLSLNEQQYGLKLNRNQVVEVLPPPQRGISRKPIGWPIWGSDGCSAVRLWTSPVSLRPSLFRMASGDEPPVTVDISLSVTAQVADPARFYSTLAADKKEYRCSDLANEIATCLEKPLQKRLNGYDAQTLNLDEGSIVSDTLARELLKEQTLQDFLATRGIALKSLSILSFQYSEVEDRLVQEVEALRDRVIQDKAELNTVLEKIATPLQSLGLATPEEVEKLKTTYSESPQEGHTLLSGMMERFGQWREEQLKGRLAQLKTTDTPAGETEKFHKKGKGWLPVIIYSLLAIAIGSGSVILYWFRFSKLGNLDLNPGHVIAGASVLALLGVGLLLITQVITDRMLHFVISKIKEHLLQRRLSQAKKAIPKTEPASVEDSRNGVEADISQPLESRSIVMKETSVPGKVEIWLTQESLKVDENVRRHVAKEMGISISNLTDARMQALRAKQNGVAQTIKDLIDRIEAFRVNVQGAAFYGSTISNRKGEIRGHATELLNFEEDLQRQTRVFQLDSEKVVSLMPEKPAEAEAEVKAMATGLRQLERHFSHREAVIEGVMTPKLPGDKMGGISTQAVGDVTAGGGGNAQGGSGNIQQIAGGNIVNNFGNGRKHDQ